MTKTTSVLLQIPSELKHGINIFYTLTSCCSTYNYANFTYILLH